MTALSFNNKEAELIFLSRSQNAGPMLYFEPSAAELQMINSQVERRPYPDIQQDNTSRIAAGTRLDRNRDNRHQGHLILPLGLLEQIRRHLVLPLSFLQELGSLCRLALPY